MAAMRRFSPPRAGPRHASSSGRDRGLCPLNLDAEPGARFRPIIPDRTMMGAAIVPECNRVRPPTEPGLEIRMGAMMREEGNDRGALVGWDIIDLGDDLACEIDQFTLGDRVLGNQGMRRDRDF